MIRGANERMGQVEYCLRNSFEPVCSGNRWAKPEAQVACNQLGFPSNVYGTCVIQNTGIQVENHFYQMKGDVGMSVHEKERK